MPTNSRKIAAAAAPPIQNGFSLISNEKLLALYVTMLKCRMLQERADGLVKRRRRATIERVTRLEAAAVGTLIDLDAADTLVSCGHDLITGFIKGASLKRALSEFQGRDAVHGARRIDSATTIAARLQAAAAGALANKTRKNNKIAVAFRGESSAAVGAWRKALHEAFVHNLPMIFLSQSGPDLDKILAGLQENKVPIMTVDGNDVVAVYRVASEAIGHARKGNGPTVIECKTLNLTGRDDGDRPCEGDPILNMETYLIRKGLFTPKYKTAASARFSRQLDAALVS